MKKQRSLLQTLLTVAVPAALGVAHSANATLILEQGLVGGSGDVENVAFNPCGFGNDTGTTVQGCLNTSPGDEIVNFTSTDVLRISGGGQASIGAVDGTFDNITIQLDDPLLGFGKLQFNLDAIADGTATFVAVDQFGASFNFEYALTGSGQNFFTLYSEDDQVAVSFSLVSTVGIQNIAELQQVRLGPTARTPPPTPVAEPSSLALFGLGLIGVGLFRRRSRRAQ